MIGGARIAPTVLLLASMGAASAADWKETIMNTFDRVDLAYLPTPLEEMKSLAAALGGPKLYVKRDDLTGLATGGNKTRKLELIFADVLAKKADVIVTHAGIQSNWARQTAAAARRLGIRPILVLSRTESQPAEVDGNLLLDELLGADVRLVEPNTDAWAMVEAIAEEERARGHRPYRVTVGGSLTGGDMTEPLGAVAYARAFAELHDQSREKNIGLTHVVLATGSGGTQAGLVVGARALAPEVKIVGISVSRDKTASRQRIAAIANETSTALGIDFQFDPEDIIVFDEYLGAGYGVLEPPTARAIGLVARNEGLLLDPVYTGKAMAGLLDLVANGYFAKEDGVVFLHSGGTPALFVYRDELMRHLDRR